MSATPDSAVVWEVLRSIPDPEFGVNIGDLGLICSAECNEGDIAVTMTLATPSCPSGGWIYKGTTEVIAGLPGVKSVNATMGFGPQRTLAMWSEAAQCQLGRID